MHSTSRYKFCAQPRCTHHVQRFLQHFRLFHPQNEEFQTSKLWACTCLITIYLSLCGQIKGTGGHCKCTTALCAKWYFPLMSDTCPGTRACISVWRLIQPLLIIWSPVADLEIQKGGFSHWHAKRICKFLGCRAHFRTHWKSELLFCSTIMPPPPSFEAFHCPVRIPFHIYGRVLLLSLLDIFCFSPFISRPAGMYLIYSQSSS